MIADFVLAARDLRRSFEAQGRRTTILHGLSLRVESGEMLCVMGPSGCGKSSLLALLAGIDLPDSGEILAGPIRVNGLSGRQAAAWRSRNVGYMFQDSGLIQRMSARDNVALPLVYSKIAAPERRARAEAALTRLGVGHLAGASVDVLSGGERRRVAFARLLAAPRPLVLCDEPTAGLDAKSAGEVIEMLDFLRKSGAAVVTATHDPAVAAIADRRLEAPLAREAEDAA